MDKSLYGPALPSLPVEHAGVCSRYGEGLDTTDGSACGGVAGREARQGDGQRNGQNERTQTEPGQAAFEAFQLPFPLP